MVATKKVRKPRLPRAPLPRQRGGAHEDKTKRPLRRRKYRKIDSDADLDQDAHAITGADR